MTPPPPASWRHVFPDRKAAFALCAVFVIVWFATLAGRSLIGPDEGRYASISLGMLQHGDWITPRLNGLLYFEKPPLQYWAGAISFWLFGINEFAARLWPALTGLATILLVGHTAARLWGSRCGWHALWICGGSTWMVANDHFLTLDAGLCAALTLTLCGVLIAHHAGPGTPSARRWMLAAWVGVGLAVLSKGLIGVVIPGAVLVLHSLWQRDFSWWRGLHWTAGIAAVAVITLPWFVLVISRNPDFARFFFIHEHFARFLTTSHQRTGAWWYFVPYLLLGFLPWTSALPWLLQWPRSAFAERLLLVWCSFIFVFFSVSDSKLPSYILPMFPALALLTARAIDKVADTAHERTLRRHLWLPGLLWLAALLALTQVDRLFSSSMPRAAAVSLAWGIGLAATLGLAGVASAWRLLGRHRRSAAITVLAATQAFAVLILMQSHDRFGQLKSADQIALALAPYLGPSTPVFAVSSYDQTLPFYLRRDVVLVDYVDEFAFGEQHEPSRWTPTIDAFADRWRGETKAAAYMGRQTFEALRQRGLIMRPVFEDTRRVVVVKP